MKSFANWMIVTFMIMFWLFRVVVTYMVAFGKSFPITPINQTTEIVLLFVTLICIALVIKRKHIGGIIYLVSYYAYFGADLFKALGPVFKGQAMNINIGLTAFISAIAVVLATVVMMDLLADKTKKKEDKQTEWFYANKDLDRQTDDRDDKNNYRIL